MKPFVALRGATLAFVAALAASCSPTLPNFDGSFPDSPPDMSDVTTDTDVIFDIDTGPATCMVAGNHCNGNGDCCSNFCSLGVHQCM